MNADPLAQLLATADELWWTRVRDVMKSGVGSPSDRLAQIPSPTECRADWLREHVPGIDALIAGDIEQLLRDRGWELIGTTAQKGPSGMAAIHVLGYPESSGRRVWAMPPKEAS